MEVYGVRQRFVDPRQAFSMRRVQLLAKGARAEPEAVSKMELRGVTATRVRHYKRDTMKGSEVILDKRENRSTRDSL